MCVKMVIGYLLAVLSSIFNGSFVAFAKLQSVACVDLHPILFNFYVACGVAVSSCLAIPWVLLAGEGELHFVYEGAIGGKRGGGRARFQSEVWVGGEAY